MSIYLGQIAALTAAACWALATILYSRSTQTLSSMQLNFVKGLIATPLLLIVAILIPGNFWQGWDVPQFALMLVSGVIGITIGDSLYFASLRRLGPGKTILLEYLAPPLAAVIAWLTLQETLSLLQGVGSLIVILGVLCVITEKQNHEGQPRKYAYYLFGVGAALCQAIGLVMAFSAFSNIEVSPIEAAFVRIGGGTLVLTVALALTQRQIFRRTQASLRHTNLKSLFFAVFVGTFLAIWLQQVAVATVSPGIAQTLLSTAPLFLLATQMVTGSKPTLRAIGGTLIAMFGIATLFIWV